MKLEYSLILIALLLPICNVNGFSIFKPPYCTRVGGPCLFSFSCCSGLCNWFQCVSCLDSPNPLTPVPFSTPTQSQPLLPTHSVSVKETSPVRECKEEQQSCKADGECCSGICLYFMFFGKCVHNADQSVEDSQPREINMPEPEDDNTALGYSEIDHNPSKEMQDKEEEIKNISEETEKSNESESLEPDQDDTEDNIAEDTEDIAEDTEDIAEATEDIAEATEDIAEAREDIAEAREDIVEDKDIAEATEEIAEAREDIVEDKDIAEATEDIAEATEDIAEATEDIAEATEDIAEAREDIAEAREDIVEDKDIAEATEEIAKDTKDIAEETEDDVEEFESITRETLDETESFHSDQELESDQSETEDIEEDSGENVYTSETIKPLLGETHSHLRVTSDENDLSSDLNQPTSEEDSSLFDWLDELEKKHKQPIK